MDSGANLRNPPLDDLLGWLVALLLVVELFVLLAAAEVADVRRQDGVGEGREWVEVKE